jgi:hypothetical protein
METIQTTSLVFLIGLEPTSGSERFQSPRPSPFLKWSACIVCSIPSSWLQMRKVVGDICSKMSLIFFRSFTHQKIDVRNITFYLVSLFSKSSKQLHFSFFHFHTDHTQNIYNYSQASCICNSPALKLVLPLEHSPCGYHITCHRPRGDFLPYKDYESIRHKSRGGAQRISL